MDYADLFRKDLKEASVIIRNMPDSELDALHEAMSHASPSFQSHYARLLVFRKDSLRLLSLLNDGEPELCHNCVRYLKIQAIRKDLMSKLTDEATFIELFNRSCDLGKSILLECLVWNKNRPSGCLADRLSQNPNLVLNQRQSAVLKSAHSVERSVEDNTVSQQKYFKLRSKEVEKTALKKLYAYLQDFSKYKKEDAVNACNKLVSYVNHLTASIPVGDKRVNALDIIVDLHSKMHSVEEVERNYLDAVSNNGTVTVDCERFEINRRLKKASQNYFSSIDGAFQIIASTVPIYVMKRIDFIQNYKDLDHYYNDFSCIVLLSLIQNAMLLNETEVLDFLLRELAQPHHLAGSHDLVSEEDLKNIEKVLTPEQYSAFLSALATNTIPALRRFSKSDNIYYTALPTVVMYLSHHLPGNDEQLLTILDLFFTFEKQYTDNGGDVLRNFYGLQVKEVPLDFSYQMCSRDALSDYKTVRKFESILCLKGNTFLNTREASDRLAALTSLVAIAGRSHDVRALHRCLMVYTRTETKFSDIRMDLSSCFSYLSPDSLGLSPASALMSGTPEEAAKARMAVVKTLCEWGLGKKGDTMVEPLMYVVCALYTHATMYPAYEETYCAMMKPVLEVLVNNNMEWTLSSFRISFDYLAERVAAMIKEKCLELRAKCLAKSKTIQQYVALERYCKGALPFVNQRLSLSSMSLVLPTLSFPNASYALPALAKSPLVMLLKMVNDETASTSLICFILSKLLTLNCNKNTYSITTKVTCPERVDNHEVVRTTTTTTPSSDTAVLTDLMNDNSFTIKGQFEDVSPFNTLQLISPELRAFMSSSALHLSAFTKVTYCVNLESEKKEKEDTFTHLLKDRNAMLSYLRAHGGDSIDKEINTALDEKMKDYAQKLMTVTHVDMSSNGLKCLLGTMNTLSLSFSVGSCKVSLEKILPLLSDEALLKLYKLASLYVFILFQSAVLAVSINKSDKPILDSSIINSLASIQPTFLKTLQTLMMINNTCSYRGMKLEEHTFAVKVLAPFLVSWLQAVKEKKVQSVSEMKSEDEFAMEGAAEESVTLDFADNEVVGRFVEILYYSRCVKEYFGKALKGAARVVSSMNIKTALIICRRLLLISSFVPIAESIFNNLLRSASASSSITEEIMSMVDDSSSGITVALIGLLFRLAANPLLKNQHEKMLQLIIKVTNYIIEHDFKSEDVYIILLRWAIAKILNPSDVSLDFLQHLLSRLTQMNVTEDAGKAVFSIVLYSALLGSECTTTLKNCIARATASTNRFVDEIEEMVKAAKKEDVEQLKKIAVGLVPSFDTTTDETMFRRQCTVLSTVRYAGPCDDLIARCESVVHEIWRPYEGRTSTVTQAAVFLYTQKGAEGMKQFAEGMRIYREMQTMKLKTKEISTLPEFAQFGVDEEAAELIDSDDLDTNLGEQFMYDSDLSDKLHVEFMMNLVDPDDSLLPFKVFYQALAKAVDMTADFSELSKVKVDAKVLVEELEKSMELWMVAQFSSFKYLLCDFNDDFMRELCAMAKEHPTDTLCWMILFCSSRNEELCREGVDACTIYIRENRKRDLYFLFA